MRNFAEYVSCILKILSFIMNFCKKISFFLISVFFCEIFAPFFRKIFTILISQKFHIFCESECSEILRKKGEFPFSFFAENPNVQSYLILIVNIFKIKSMIKKPSSYLNLEQVRLYFLTQIQIHCCSICKVCV